jgi:hypothetical protein
MAVNKIYKLKFLSYSLIFSFIFLIAAEATPNTAASDSYEEFKPVVRVQEEKERIPDVQKDRFDKLFAEGKKLYQEQMDYEGAIEKFNEALDLTATRTQKSDVFYHLSLAHYGDLSRKGTEELYETIRRLLELDYYRELNEILCPPKYIELFEGIKKEYGALRIQSKPAGADVYINDSEIPAGKTPLMIGAKAGSLTIKIKKGKKAKNDILKVVAGKETTSPVYVLKGVSTLTYVIGGIALAVGTGAVLLLKGGAGEEGQAPGPTTGSIQVNSTPQGASIYLDGAATGQTTNSTLTNVSSGSHTVTLVKEGYEDYGQNISVTAGQTTTVNANLTAVVITVTNPTSSTIWTKGVDVTITWGSSGSPSFRVNSRRSNGLNPLSDSGRNLLPSFRRPTLRSIYSFRNFIRTRRNSDNRSNLSSSSIKEISSYQSTKINLHRPSNAQDVSRKFSSSSKEVNISRQTARNSGIIKRNKGFGKFNPPVSKRISPQIGKSSRNTRMLSLTNVKIDLYKGGVLQELIEPNTENDGTYTWTVNASLPDGSDYKVRISSVSEPGTYDESDNFTIEMKSITVTEPKSNTIWTTGDSSNITWTSTGTISDVQIDLYNGGTFEETIEPSTANDGDYTWTQVNPALADDSDYRVRISWISDAGVYDESEDFTIETKSITVTEPASSTIWTKGAAANIIWTSTGTMSDVKIDLYKGVILVETIESKTANDGSYTWSQVNPTLADDSDYRVRISWISDAGVYDESEDFAIETKSITVTEPTSSTVWTKGNSAIINWTSTGNINDVKIELYRGGGFVETIVSSTTNNGTYTWTQVNPALQSAANYKVKIICISVPEIYDESEYFTIN